MEREDGAAAAFNPYDPYVYDLPRDHHGRPIAPSQMTDGNTPLWKCPAIWIVAGFAAAVSLGLGIIIHHVNANNPIRDAAKFAINYKPFDIGRPAPPHVLNVDLRNTYEKMKMEEARLAYFDGSDESQSFFLNLLASPQEALSKFQEEEKLERLQLSQIYAFALFINIHGINDPAVLTKYEAPRTAYMRGFTPVGFDWVPYPLPAFQEKWKEMDNDSRNFLFHRMERHLSTLTNIYKATTQTGEYFASPMRVHIEDKARHELARRR